MKKQRTLIFLFLGLIGQMSLMGQVSKVSTYNSPEKSMLITDSATLPGYNIYRNGIKVNAEPIGQLEFADSVPENGNYTYYVTAIYQEGESTPSNVVEVFIDQKAVLHNYVVFEEGTGTWCQYCPGAAMGLEDLIANDKQVLGIAYHDGDDYKNSAAASRINFYGVSGFPTAIFDGITKVEGGSHTESLYPSYLPIYEDRAQAYGPFLMTTEGTVNGPSYSTKLHIEKVGTLRGTNLKVVAAVVEDDINFNWQGQSKLNAVERIMVPNANGTSVDFRTGNTQDVDLNFEVDSSWNLDNCTLIAFIQDFDSKEILQATKLILSDFLAPLAPLKSTGLTTLFSPYGLTAEYTMVSPTVNLTWKSAGSSSWMEWDNGENASAIGDGSSELDFDVAARWEVQDIKALDGMKITKLAFYPNESTCNYSIRIWEGADTDSLMIDSLLPSIKAGSWNEIVLKTPVIIDTAQELWAGYYNNNTAKKYSAGCDSGPAVVGKGDKIRLYTKSIAGDWENISSYGIDANWNIKFYIEPIVEPTDTTSIAEAKRADLNLYPNPASHYVIIESNQQIHSLYVIGINGQLITIRYEVGKSAEIDLSNCQSGIYFVKIETDLGYSFRKLVVE